MATFITQRDAAITAYEALIYPNSVGAIDGQVHQDSGVGQLESVYQNLVGYDNYSYVIVRTGVDSTGAEVNTFLQNGINLIAAYNAAKLLTPNGSALSATNRVAVLVPPGRYDLGANLINANTEYVDLIGLGDSPEDVVINGVLVPGTLVQSANNMIIKGVTLKYSGPNPIGVAYLPTNTFSSTKMENVILDGNGVNGVTPANDGLLEFSGTYKNVKAVNYAGNAWDNIINGTVFIGCTCDGPGFAVTASIIAATMTDCEATSGFGETIGGGVFARCKTTSGDGFGTVADCIGTFTDCHVAGNGFGVSGCNGSYVNCSAVGSAFGYLPLVVGPYSINGQYIGCRAGDSSFGSGFCTRSGYFKDCIGGDLSFGDGTNPVGSAIHENCSAGNNSFNSGWVSSKYIGCRAGNDSFVLLAGAVEGCSAGNRSFNLATPSCFIKDCSAGDESFNNPGGLNGTYINCTAGSTSFNSWTISTAVTSSGTIQGCKAGDYSFMSFNGNAPSTTSIIFTGVMKDCIGGLSSFGGCYNTGIAKVIVYMQGFIDNCTGGDYSFYGVELGPAVDSSIESVVSNCIGGRGSFCGNGGIVAAIGSLINCHLVDSVTKQLGAASWGGEMRGRMENCSWIITGASNDCVAVNNGAKIYNCTLVAGAGGASVISVSAPTVVSASIAHCRMQTAIDATVTNTIATPYNVIDTDI